MTEQEKYDKLVVVLNRMFEESRQEMLSALEPKYPLSNCSKESDLTGILQYQRDIKHYDHAHSYFTVMNHIVNFVIPNLRYITTTKDWEGG